MSKLMNIHIAMTVINTLPVVSSCCSPAGKWGMRFVSSNGKSRIHETGRGQAKHVRVLRRSVNQLRLFSSQEPQTTSCLAVSQSPTRVGQYQVLSLRWAASDFVCHCRRSPTHLFRQRDNKKREYENSTTRTRAWQGNLNHEREEARWLREEQRWLREEKRWQVQEARLSAENLALRNEVVTLRTELIELRRQRESGNLIADLSLKSLASGLRSVLQALPPHAAKNPALGGGNLGEVSGFESIPEIIANPSPVPSMEAEPPLVTTSSAPEKVVAVVTPTSYGPAAVTSLNTSPSSDVPISSLLTKETLSSGRKRRTLKGGMEGDDVKELQDTLALLGYYCGEEEMEYSVFSSGTTSAVLTWQATVGLPQDGLVTEDSMLAMLAEHASKMSDKADRVAQAVKTVPNQSKEKTLLPSKSRSSNKVRSVEIKRHEQSDAQETSGGSLSRVYLLGENRWEEPGRLGENQAANTITSNGTTSAPNVKMCFACRGVGTVMCTDCEGTGDLNVEEQFLEWTDDDACCPYCGGLGTIVCDICNGTLVVPKA